MRAVPVRRATGASRQGRLLGLPAEGPCAALPGASLAAGMRTPRAGGGGTALPHPEKGPDRAGRAHLQDSSSDQVAPHPAAGIPSEDTLPGHPNGRVPSRLAHRHRPGRPDPGVAEGEDGVRHRAVPAAGKDRSTGGGDRPPGRCPAPGRGASGPRAALSCLPVHRHIRGERGRADGARAGIARPLRRGAGRTRPHGIPPAGGTPLHPAPGHEPHRLMENGGHDEPILSAALRASRPGHQEGHPVRPRPALRFTRHLRPLRRGLPQRQHRGDGAIRSGQELRDQAGTAAGHIARHRLLRHRPRGRVRVPGPGRRRKSAHPRASPATASTPLSSIRTTRARCFSGWEDCGGL